MRSQRKKNEKKIERKGGLCLKIDFIGLGDLFIGVVIGVSRAHVSAALLMIDSWLIIRLLLFRFHL